ncbi:MAG: DinB family protein [Candidatus Rokubacteria bacterium]|nr:DinB family protein [Candidatus Rokubacteria bacterium]
MPFAYYQRLSRAQQAIYRKSDERTEIRLPDPAALRPLVAALEHALETEDRAVTQAATERMINGLNAALGIPAVRVEVLAARPHRDWGELHGLYTQEPRRPAKIQLWMRTAKQRRVVAFRTYLRTLLHEVGHHIDYAYLGLDDSFHTEGFYKRESSLFHQLVSDAAIDATRDGARWAELRNASGKTPAHYAKLGRAERLERLARAPGELARVLRGRSESKLTRRPDETSWSAAEVVCHLRDAEEHLSGWMRLVLAVEEPPLLTTGTADRWAEERQYHRQHAGDAWNAFSRRRDETLELVPGLDETRWTRAGRHARWGRVTVDDLLSLMAWHDDNHLDQIRRALEGRA